MKPYPKILRSENSLNWNGFYQWDVSLLVVKDKPKIPLRFFSRIHPLTAERNHWLKMRAKIVMVENDKERNPELITESLRLFEAQQVRSS